jgi:hypothetical protein
VKESDSIKYLEITTPLLLPMIRLERSFTALVKCTTTWRLDVLRMKLTMLLSLELNKLHLSLSNLSSRLVNASLMPVIPGLRKNPKIKAPGVSSNLASALS